MAHATTEQIADNIRVARARAKLNQAEFVVELNVIGTPGKWTQSRVSNIERGLNAFKAEVLPYLAEALDTTVDDLLRSPEPTVTLDASLMRTPSATPSAAP